MSEEKLGPFTDVEMGMIRRGDMLGERLGSKLFAYLRAAPTESDVADVVESALSKARWYVEAYDNVGANIEQTETLDLIDKVIRRLASRSGDGAAARVTVLEEAARVAEAEPEFPGAMPPAIAALPPEDLARASCRATKKAIAKNIRALSALTTPTEVGGEKEGWVLVPIEPTQAMKKAGWEARRSTGYRDPSGSTHWGDIASVYWAMLAAIPPKGGANG